MRKKRRITVILLSIVAVAATAVVAMRYFAPRAMAPARVADPAAAQAAGARMLAEGGTTLVVIAHPDDLEWWAGGTAALLAEKGPVVLVLGTSGEKGDGGLVADLGAKREQLQRDGGEILGYTEVVFLRHPDGALAEAATFPSEIASAIGTYEPERIITFDVEKESAGYHHVDHEAAGRAATDAAREAGGIELLLMHTSAPDVIVDYAAVKEDKARAFKVLTSYRSLTPVVGPLSSWLGALVGTKTIQYGSRAAYPTVGIEYGEVFRSVVIPKK